MFRVFNCLTEQHDWRLVVAAALLVVLVALPAIRSKREEAFQEN